MGIGAVVALTRQGVGQVHVGGPWHSLIKGLKHSLKVHGKITVFFCQIVTLIGNHRHKYGAAGILQIFVIDKLELFQGVIYRVLVQRVLQFGGIAVRHIDIVVIRLIQCVVVKQGLDLPEGIPQRKLVQGKALKLAHKFAIQQCFHGDLGHLFQRTAFRFGNILDRTEPCPGCQHQP